MGITKPTKKLIEQVIRDHATEDDLRDIADYITDAHRRIRQGAQGVSGSAGRPGRPGPSGSGNVKGSSAPLSPARPRPGRGYNTPQTAAPTARRDIMEDWGPSGTSQDDDSIHYTPDKKEYVDDDFERAKRNRAHIDKVMRELF